MEFYIGAEFSREFNFEERKITHLLAGELNTFFKKKNYGNRIEKLNINVICVSKIFEAFCVIRPAKISRKEPMIVYELKLDFDNFKFANEKERKKILITKIFNVTKEVLTKKIIRDFDKEMFLKDLELYLLGNGID